MATPIWITPAGSLGTIQEQIYFEIELEAIDPDRPTDQFIKYKIISGRLPIGLSLSDDGSINGISTESYYVNGVPVSVTEDTTSVFVVRATDQYTNKITDRTFSITVTGEDPPVITTAPGSLGVFLDGTAVEISLEAFDLDNEPIHWSLSAGSLPPGLSLNETTGVISGFIELADFNQLADAGWSSNSSWDLDPWDFGSRANSTSYQFSVYATDGKTYDSAAYTIFVYSRDALTADNDFITTDIDQIVTADADIKRNPVLITKPADLGVYVHDNYFAYRFIGKDFDFDEIEYSLLIAAGVGFDNELSGFDSTLLDLGEFSLPPGLTLNSETGWMYGQIPRQITGQTDYRFAVQVYKKNYPTYKSQLSFFTLTIINDLRYLINWTVDSNLGKLDTGSISEKYVSASNPLNRPLTYSLISGKLPQGLKLLPDGLIVGRSSFEVTSFDKNTTTFDQTIRNANGFILDTTIDLHYEFVVQARDPNGEMISFRTFTIDLNPSNFAPYESLYLKAQPTTDDRILLQSIFRNTDILPADAIYRASDPNFGRPTDLRMLLVSGLPASQAADYIDAMGTNHYRKLLKFGTYEWARAFDENNNYVYDAVYMNVIDDLSDETVSAPQSVAVSNGTVYPNSLINMRTAMKNALGSLIKEPLPRWMTTKQSNGKTLGWTPAVIIAYVKPGQGDRVVFNLNRLTGLDIKLVNFDSDRYIWDTNLSKNWNAEQQIYEESTLTTFDVIENPSTIVATVDYAVDIPFANIEGRTTAFIDALNGFDGVIDSYIGKRIIFATQENYLGFEGEYDGWVRYNSIWDDESGWSNPSSSWDDYEVIPGYYEDDGSTRNQRSAVWQVVEGADGEIRLELDQLVEIGDKVEVKYGAKYGGFILRFGPHILFSENETVPKYQIFDSNQLSLETTFDNGDTRFINSISIYQAPDNGDKYLAYPKQNIWA